ncbi:MAG: ComF family protein [Pseudoramibacter sp.]|jgi:competence protein ComFC
MKNKLLEHLSRLLLIDNDRCPVCKKILWKKEAYLCDQCLRELPKNDARTCRRCGRPLSSDDADLCSACRSDAKRPIDRGWVWLVYGRAAEQIAAGFKFNYQKTLAYWAGAQMAKDLADCPWMAEVDALIPVPLHPNRLSERGYNQSEQLALGIVSGLMREKGIAITLDAESLRRVVDTPHQLGQTAAFRLKNVKNAFDVVDPERVYGKRIALVDDVMTTGATLDACAAALKQAGAADVAVITFAAVPS